MLHDLHLKFTTKWNQWMKEIEEFGASPLQSSDIEKEIFQELSNHCGVEKIYDKIKESVQSQSLSARAKSDLYLFMNVSKEKHININQDISSRIVTSVKSWIPIWNVQTQETVYQMINRKTASILLERKKYLDSIFEDDEKDQYPIGEIIGIVQSTQQDIEQLEKEVTGMFTFTAQYRVDVILTVCGYALRVFEKIQKRSQENHPVTYFKSLEIVYRNNFVSLCTQGVEQKAIALQNTYNSATNLSALVIRSIRSELSVQLTNALENKLRHKRTFFRIKKALKREILLRLLKERNFDLYAMHLTNVSESYLYWMKIFVDEECHSVLLANDKCLIIMIAEEELQSMKVAVVNVVKENRSNSTIENWLDTFHERVDMSVNKKDLMKFVGKHSIQRFDLFKRDFLEKFDSDMKDLVDELQSDQWQPIFNSCKDRVTSTFHKKTSGCCVQCPFCKEQCESTTPSHPGNHSCDIHRPQCLGGYRGLNTQQMFLKLCNDYIRGDGTFQCKETDEKQVPYKDYRKYFPDWVIDNSATHVPRYWQWFIGAYTKEIAAHFSMKEPAVEEQKTVSSWRTLSTVDAEKDIEEKYKIVADN